MKYISREDFCEESCGVKNREGYKTCKNCSMLNVPSSDVQPIRTGRWIDIYEWAKMHDSIPSGMGLYFWCSECQEEQTKKSNFCPNCGVKMIEEEKSNG